MKIEKKNIFSCGVQSRPAVCANFFCQSLEKRQRAEKVCAQEMRQWAVGCCFSFFLFPILLNRPRASAAKDFVCCAKAEKRKTDNGIACGGRPSTASILFFFEKGRQQKKGRKKKKDAAQTLARVVKDGTISSLFLFF
nr:hypothetical protein [Pandoravirus aubagnensis]